MAKVGPNHPLHRIKKKWIGDAVQHPGAEKAAAKAHGLSTLEEANRESHSSDSSIRARGNLARRFIKKSI